MTNENGTILRLEEMPFNIQCYLSYALETVDKHGNQLASIDDSDGIPCFIRFTGEQYLYTFYPAYTDGITYDSKTVKIVAYDSDIIDYAIEFGEELDIIENELNALKTLIKTRAMKAIMEELTRVL